VRFTENFEGSRRFFPACLLCIWSILLLPLPALARESLQPLLEQLSSRGELLIAGARITNLPVTREFYQRTDYAPAWTDPAAVFELSASIEQAWREGMNPVDYHRDQVADLLDGSLSLDQSARDLLLTDSLVRLTYHYALGKVDPRDYAATWNFARRSPQLDPVDWLMTATREGGIGDRLDRLKPTAPAYLNLAKALAQYRAIADRGGWGPVSGGPALRRGDDGPRVAQLRARLRAEGDLAGGASAQPDFFDSDLEQALIRFQRRHRLDADGVVGRQTLAALNVPVGRRIDQIRVNLERARVLQEIPPTAVVVDIAGFEVSLFRDGRRLLRTRAQVGKPYRSTPVFRDTITYVEFNPTWTVPPTILEQDVLPAIREDSDYLNRRNMQVLSMAGNPVDPETVDWQAYPQQSFPYMIRQLPGPDNALGRVKIMFPNEHMVYLHDTPSRSLFNRSTRSFSSGCIRVEQVERLVELLLDDPLSWDRTAIDRMIAGRQTRRVSLAEPMPIYLVYWTVEVSEAGEVHFKQDPYHRDPALLQALERPLMPEARRIDIRAG
jgi:murein L,D-transpeptidase YcbB/YkuD